MFTIEQTRAESVGTSTDRPVTDRTGVDPNWEGGPAAAPGQIYTQATVTHV